MVMFTEKYTYDIKTIPVLWYKPPGQWVKVNSDGSSLNNPGAIGGRGIIENNSGNFLFAYAVPLGEGSNNQAKMETAVFGVAWCIHLGYEKVILEVDSELMYKWVTLQSAPSWQIVQALSRL